MGMYTEIYVNVDLVRGVPQEVLDVLSAICNKEHDSIVLSDKPSRWFVLFNNGSYYTPNTEIGSLTYDDISRQWSLIGKGDIKNYNSEIQSFFDWLNPYVDAFPGEFIGYIRYEEDDVPTLVLKEVD